VKGGTKLQELPEIKNCVRGSAPTGQKGKEEALAKEKKLRLQSREAAKKTIALRLGAFERDSLLFS
jgi:hypothetical protein